MVKDICTGMDEMFFKHLTNKSDRPDRVEGLRFSTANEPSRRFIVAEL
jgi:hypothetical protein